MRKWIVLGYWIALQSMCMSHVTFTNLKCHALNPKFNKFDTCEIKAVNRTHKYINIYSRHFMLPVRNVWVSTDQYNNNGYKQMYELSYDGCKFLRENKNPLIQEFYNTFKSNSNLNHTCPYNHDVIVNRLYTGNLEDGFLRFVHVLQGEYALYTEWITEGILRATVNVYVKISDK
ncbi:hypothetical protein KR018_001526 [Drosophila ironensis]|nr:hypothetical protein KR018_001526 [Drosophila ironensis]